MSGWVSFTAALTIISKFMQTVYTTDSGVPTVKIDAHIVTAGSILAPLSFHSLRLKC